MPEEKKKIEVGLGSKGEKPGAGQEVKKTKKPEPADEVGGRYQRINVVICPYCHNSTSIVEETTMRLPYECVYCSNVFWY